MRLRSVKNEFRYISIIAVIVFQCVQSVAVNLDSLYHIVSEKNTPQNDQLNAIILLESEEISKAQDLALSYSNKTFVIAEKTKNKKALAICRYNKALLHMLQNKTAQALSDVNKSIVLFEIIQDKKGLARSNLLLGSIKQKQGKNEEALTQFQKVLQLLKSEADSLLYSDAYIALGSIYLNNNKVKLARFNFEKALDHAKQNHELKALKSSYLALSNLGVKTKDYKMAYEFGRHYNQISDSMYQIEHEAELLRLKFKKQFDEMQLTLEKIKLQKDFLMKEDLKDAKFQKNFYLMGFTILMLLAMLIYSRFKKTIKQRNLIEGQRDWMNEQKLAAEELREKAEASEKFKQQFLSNMSHEIRTPMNAVIGMTNLVLDTPLNQKQQFYLEGIKKSSNNLLHIINDILDLSKIEAGKMELEKIDFSLKDIGNEIIQTLQHKADEKGLELIFSMEAAVEEIVIGDPVRLYQILMNLAGNAIKFTESGKVTVSISKGQKGTQFMVSDTGIGIAKDKIATVFESFSQANSSDTRKYGGTGLGLTICKQLVSMMGSNIEIESELGKGTSFYFELVLPTGDIEKINAKKQRVDIDGSILNGLSVLVVDDVEYNRIVVSDTLTTKSKLTLLQAVNGQEAIDVLNNNHVDIILMDVQMPVMDGYTATEYIRKNLDAPKCNVPIIALTAAVIRKELDKCKAVGMNDCVPKPFEVNQLLTTMALVLDIELKYASIKPVHESSAPSVVENTTNLTYLKKFCENDETRMKKYIKMFLDTAPTLQQNVLDAMAINDFEDVANQIHGYKTKWIMMGMENAKKLALEIENDCREGRIDEALQQKINSLMHMLNTGVKELETT